MTVLSTAERKVLELLAERGPMFVLDLRAASLGLGLSFRALYVIIGAMEERQLIEGRGQPPFSGRRFALTSIGRRTLEAIA